VDQLSPRDPEVRRNGQPPPPETPRPNVARPASPSVTPRTNVASTPRASQSRTSTENDVVVTPSTSPRTPSSILICDCTIPQEYYNAHSIEYDLMTILCFTVMYQKKDPIIVNIINNLMNRIQHNGQTQDEKDFTGILIMTTILWAKNIYLPDLRSPISFNGMWKGRQHNSYIKWMKFFDASRYVPGSNKHPLYNKALQALKENQRKRKAMTTLENVWINRSGRRGPVGPFAQNYSSVPPRSQSRGNSSQVRSDSFPPLPQSRVRDKQNSTAHRSRSWRLQMPTGIRVVRRGRRIENKNS
jgi:hypothetical protein